MSRGFITRTEDGILIKLRVSPGAKRTSLEGPCGEGAIRLRFAAPPTAGKANAEVERFLAVLLGTPRSEITVVRGASSRDKVVLVRRPGQVETRKILSAHIR